VPSTPPRVQVAVGASFELLAAVWAFLDEERHPVYEVGSDWLRGATQRLGPDARQIRRFAAGSLRVWDHVLGLACEAGPPYDVVGLLSLIAELDPPALRLHLLGRYNRAVGTFASPERIEAAASGDPAALRAFRRRAFPDEANWQRAVRQLVRSDPEVVRDELLFTLRLWNERVFEAEAERIIGILERDAERTRAAAAERGPLDLIDHLTDGMRWAIDARFDEVLLAPTYVARPVVYYVEHRDMTLLMYPVAEESVQGGELAVPGRLVKLAKALADEGRLKVLYALRDHDLPVRELAERLGVPRTTLWHHILILKDAGLIRTTGSGPGQTALQLREEAVPDVGELLERFLASDPTPRLARPRTRR